MMFLHVSSILILIIVTRNCVKCLVTTAKYVVYLFCFVSCHYVNWINQKVVDKFS